MKSLTVVAKDKIGLLADISYIIGKAKINLDAISVEVAGDVALVHMSAKDISRAPKLLEGSGYSVVTPDSIIVRTPHETHEKIASALSEHAVSIIEITKLAASQTCHYYRLKADKMTSARHVLREHIWPPQPKACNEPAE